VLLALAGIFHDAIFRFAFPPPPAPAATDVAQPAAPRPAEHRAAAAHPPAHPAHVASAPKTAAPAAHAAPERPASTPPAASAAAGQTDRPAATAEPETAARKAPPVKPAAAAAPSHANPPAHVASAAKPKAARRRDATTALLDAAAGDVAAPRCATPDAPARVVSNVIPVVSKYRGTAAAGGSADISVSLSAAGDVTGVAIANSSGSADLDAAAEDAARRSSYRAATSNCSPVAGSLILHVRF